MKTYRLLAMIALLGLVGCQPSVQIKDYPRSNLMVGFGVFADPVVPLTNFTATALSV